MGEGASDATPDVAADATPDVAADATPEVNADRMLQDAKEANADRTLQDAKEVAEEVKKKELAVKQPMSLSKEGRSRISRFLNTPCGHSGGL